MAWKDNLQDASFKGKKFEVINTTETVEHALSEHSYPFKDGVDVEDLGRRHRSFSLKAVIWGDVYEKKLQELIKVFDEADSGELIHPIYGSIPNVQLKNYKISHEADNVDYCEIEIEFVESVAGVDFFSKTLPSQKIQLAKMAQLKAQNIGVAMFASAINGLKGNLALVDGFKASILNNIMGIKNNISGAFSLVSNVLNSPLSFCADVAYAAKGLLSLKPFSALTFKSDLRSIKQSFSTFIKVDDSTKRSTLVNIKTSPTPSVSEVLGIKKSIPNDILIINDDKNVIGEQKQGDSISNVTILSPDDVVRTTIKLILVTELSTEVCEVFARELEVPTLSPIDINNVVNDVRLSVDDLVHSISETYPDTVDRYALIRSLKDAAYDVAVCGQMIVEVRPPLVEKIVKSNTNLHLLAFFWYGDYNRADELLRLNPNIRLPNRVEKGTVINAYEK